MHAVCVLEYTATLASCVTSLYAMLLCLHAYAQVAVSCFHGTVSVGGAECHVLFAFCLCQIASCMFA